jgi:hypothetical protein
MSNATIQSFIDTFAAPNLVFDRIKDKSISAWIPLILMIVLTFVIFGWYFMTVDMYQFMETSMSISGQEMADAEFEVMMQQEQVIRIMSVVSAGIGTLVIYLILALFYFLAATLIAEEKFGYGQFLSVISWAGLPALISFLSITISLVLAEGFVYVAFLDKTALSSLLGMTLEDPNFNLASQLNIATIWSYSLYGIGFARLTRCSAVTATIVALIPPAIQFSLAYFL